MSPSSVNVQLLIFFQTVFSLSTCLRFTTLVFHGKFPMPLSSLVNSFFYLFHQSCFHGKLLYVIMSCHLSQSFFLHNLLLPFPLRFPCFCVAEYLQGDQDQHPQETTSCTNDGQRPLSHFISTTKGTTPRCFLWSLGRFYVCCLRTNPSGCCLSKCISEPTSLVILLEHSVILWLFFTWAFFCKYANCINTISMIASSMCGSGIWNTCTSSWWPQLTR